MGKTERNKSQEIKMLKLVENNFGLLRWLSSKESVCNRGVRVQSLGREDALEKEMATHSSILAWKILWTEEPGRFQSVHGVTKELDKT